MITSNTEVREMDLVNKPEARAFLMETTRHDLERLFTDYLMQVFKIETMDMPKGLSIIVMQYFFSAYEHPLTSKQALEDFLKAAETVAKEMEAILEANVPQ